MDQDPDVAARLAQLERKVDQVLVFTGQLEPLLAAFLARGKGRALTALARMGRGGGEQP